MMDEREVRAWPMAELRVDEGEDGPRIVGHAAVFDQLSEVIFGFREIVEPGAFRDVLDQDVRALWQHDMRYVLGRTANETLQVEEDEQGLRIEALPPDTTWAQDALTSMRRGDVDQMSFSFDVAEGGDHWAEDEDGMMIRRIQTIERLYDVAPVTFPAYPQTSVQVRSILAAAGIDFEALVGVVSRSRAGLELRREDRVLVEEMVGWLDGLLVGPGAEGGDQGQAGEEASVRACLRAGTHRQTHLDRMRRRLDLLEV